ncbi:uncharacterized protein LOC114742091 [Neltuma alba]|uniref:uncharacterized protein LOC114728406 n=1 Tax=Neltuma alba TaxID=207710 RepID=UPI0010A41FED|nr:uncharacterized protein LOC114728406 [Prosopis alba]XP_028786189.1 uncharacterized protein LOC114742091 [Prosopis alba]
MSINLMKTILLAVSVLLIASDYSDATKSRVENNLDKGQTLTLSCTYYAANKTKIVTVAGVLGSNQVKEFSLDPKVTPTINCTFKWEGASDHFFPIYSDLRDNPYCLTECTWSIKQDRPCRVDPNNSQITYYCDTWIIN